jgi:S-DNA-T family DNA segregation ATPase FtsK/SpoIIIE
VLPAGSTGAHGELELAVGLGFDTLRPARLVVPDGEHVLVAGPARSGRTTALLRLLRSWREANPDGEVISVGRSARGISDHVSGDARVVESAGQLDALDGYDVLGPDGWRRLVVIDDAERVDDPHGRLAALVASRRPGLLVVAAGRPEALRPLYGHWTALVRRSRLGLLMAACAETDGDVLGELLPRHPPLPLRPGLAWIVGGGTRALVQIGH